jgi:hypothetical protein
MNVQQRDPVLSSPNAVEKAIVMHQIHHQGRATHNIYRAIVRDMYASKQFEYDYAQCDHNDAVVRD